jgi:hypothetical protein
MKSCVAPAMLVGYSGDEPKAARSSDWMRSQAAKSDDAHFNLESSTHTQPAP